LLPLLRNTFSLMLSARSIFAAFFIFLITACNSKKNLFEKITSDHSGIHFNNKIVENDTINPIDLVNIYNGGGVGIGDFNNDNLPDIYFTGNMVSNRLYLNKGDFQFEDVTQKAGVEGSGQWGRGVAVVDINNDGLSDLYICNTIYSDSVRRKNTLYVNKGVNKEGAPKFVDMADAYGLNIMLQSTMSSFFDYDNDGDLDMYLTVNGSSYKKNPNRFSADGKKDVNLSAGRLYRNDWDSAKNQAFFHDVSEEAGITLDGYGHGATVVDINRDGWKDVYVTNDFLSDNILYVNNQNGTFTNKSKDYFKHTSYNAMGQDIADINNDGLADVIELDMSPEDNYRKKMMLNASNYNTFQNFDLFKYQYQYVRNTLQLNQGPRVGQNDSIGDPIFSEIGFMSGVAQTDWSWTPLVTDFNNDSYRDIIVTNGFPKDVSDHDFMSYREEFGAITPKKDILEQIPEIKIHNYAFANKGDLTFSDATYTWGLSEPSFSNGAAFADFDNNGTMDMVINNINDEASIYKNTGEKSNDSEGHFLQVKFNGGSANTNGIGAWAEIYYNNGKRQVYENTPYRGYLSTMQCIAHFGLGSATAIDSLIIKWPNGKKQSLLNIKTDQLVKVDIADAKQDFSWEIKPINEKSLFREITGSAGVTYLNRIHDFIDYNIQTTLPHKFSEYTPALAAGDIDGNGLDDIIAGGNSAYPTQVLLQQTNGKFIQRNLDVNDSAAIEGNNDAGILIFDSNGDGSNDVYIASGGYKYEHNSPRYQDRLFVNDGKGKLSLATDALPLNYTSKLCVRAFDYNADGKTDIFVSGRVDPWHYPKPVSSCILRNDSDKDHVKFTDVTTEVAPMLKDIGMVCDAIFTDFDDDQQTDLVLAGEWMPVTFLKNTNGKFKNVTNQTGISNNTGWWNTIAAGDFRHTGKTDYIVGNVGLNTLYQVNDERPVYITAKDFDNNGSYVPLISLYLKDQKGDLKEFPVNSRDEVVERLPGMKKRFNHYNVFAKSTMNEIFPAEKQAGALRLQANILQSCYVRNDGNGKFTMIPLPKEAQMSVLNGIAVEDFDGDGNLDVLLNGNDHGTEVTIGRYDALNGLLLKGDGKGNFGPMSILESGIYIPGNGKGLVKLVGNKGNYLVASSETKGPLKLFELKTRVNTLKVNPDDRSAIIEYNNGTKRKDEFYYGASFLSQSARFISFNEKVKSITITDNKGKSRAVLLNLK
jgi:hypothetical protein